MLDGRGDAALLVARGDDDGELRERGARVGSGARLRHGVRPSRTAPASRGSPRRGAGSPRGCRGVRARAPSPTPPRPARRRGPPRGGRRAAAPASLATAWSPKRSPHQSLSWRSDMADAAPPPTLTTRGASRRRPESICAVEQRDEVAPGAGSRAPGARWPPKPMYRSGTAPQPAVDPVGEDALVGPAELSGAGEHAAAVDPDGEAEGVAVLERELLARELGRAVERDGRRGRELSATPVGGHARRQRARRVGLEGPVRRPASAGAASGGIE